MVILLLEILSGKLTIKLESLLLTPYKRAIYLGKKVIEEYIIKLTYLISGGKYVFASVRLEIEFKRLIGPTNEITKWDMFTLD